MILKKFKSLVFFVMISYIYHNSFIYLQEMKKWGKPMKLNEWMRKNIYLSYCPKFWLFILTIEYGSTNFSQAQALVQNYYTYFHSNFHKIGGILRYHLMYEATSCLFLMNLIALQLIYSIQSICHSRWWFVRVYVQTS